MGFSDSFMRLALGASTPVPRRFDNIENFLIGKKPSKEILSQAAEKLSIEAEKLSGNEQLMIYKKPAIKGLFLRVMMPLLNSKSDK